ncbi:hypothetical protein CPB86DRAFT_813090 [Serendipita vermifera]|nr:hypothetical protein CPB86DRAFT_813090 [Serendipita vermifera]
MSTLALYFCEDYFELPFSSWFSKLRAKLARINKQVDSQPTAIRLKRLFLAHWPPKLLPLSTRNRTPYLPPEIWEKILDFAVHVPFVFDTSCNAANFHQFVSSQFYLPNASTSAYRLVESRRKTLRLVCQMWKELLDRRSHRWEYDEPFISDEKINGVQRADFSLAMRFVDAHWIGEVSESVNRMLANPELSSLTTISINDTVYLDDIGRTAISDLFSRMSRLPKLQAFSYGNRYGHANFTLPQLQTYFASITCLHIETVKISGSLHLERLEVLYLRVNAGNSSSVPAKIAQSQQIPYPAFSPSSFVTF